MLIIGYHDMFASYKIPHRLGFGLRKSRRTPIHIAGRRTASTACSSYSTCTIGPVCIPVTFQVNTPGTSGIISPVLSPACSGTSIIPVPFPSVGVHTNDDIDLPVIDQVTDRGIIRCRLVLFTEILHQEYHTASANSFPGMLYTLEK